MSKAADKQFEKFKQVSPKRLKVRKSRMKRDNHQIDSGDENKNSDKEDKK